MEKGVKFIKIQLLFHYITLFLIIISILYPYLLITKEGRADLTAPASLQPIRCRQLLSHGLRPRRVSNLDA